MSSFLNINTNIDVTMILNIGVRNDDVFDYICIEVFNEIIQASPYIKNVSLYI